MGPCRGSGTLRPEVGDTFGVSSVIVYSGIPYGVIFFVASANEEVVIEHFFSGMCPRLHPWVTARDVCEADPNERGFQHVVVWEHPA